MPQRWSGTIQPWIAELAIGLALPAAFVAIRFPLIGLMGDRAPYALNFLAVASAAVLAGWRSGLVALVFGQLLTWFLIVEPQWSLAIADAERGWALAAATVSQSLMLLVIALYQREVDRGVTERERRLKLLEDARHEIDHRVRNNYQTVLALVQMQLQRASDEGERRLLQQVVDRIKAVSLATDRLAFRSESDLRTIRLREHLCQLCEDLERGLSREEVTVHCEVSDVPANAVFATYLAIIVNELVTNALKHAFSDRENGEVRVEAKQQNSGLELIVADNGGGMGAKAANKGTGLGQKLVHAFVLQLGGKHEVSSTPNGTVHRIYVPSLA